MITFKNISAVFVACTIVFISCNTSLKKPGDSEDSVEREDQLVISDESEEAHDRFIPAQNGSVDDARRKAERSLTLANKEIEKAHDKIDDLFNSLIEAKRQLADAEESQ